ncbi:MAG: hypothetical protein ACRDH0_06105 [Actinomycetota bacterium]
MQSRGQIRPSEPAPDEAGTYAHLEGRWRAENRLSPTATIKRCEAKWQWLVQQIEAGYDDDEYEWENDLDSRKIIQRAIDELPSDLAVRLAARVRPWDRRFMAATRAVEHPYWSGGWWADRVPAKLGPKLAADLADYL